MKALLLPLALGVALAAPPAAARTWGSLEFTDCELPQPDSGATLRAECATLDVPENPDAPAGRRITLRIAMIAARAGEPAPDPMVFFAGGPGQAATESWAGAAPGFARLREKRHVLLVDQRGTGGSSRLACEIPLDLESGDAVEAVQRRMAMDCLAALGDSDPAMYTTSVAVRDIEAVRQAIGAPQLNLVGGSYGTRAAQEYARQFPGAVRSIILDGVVPPGLALGSEHAVNLEAALKAILAGCATQPGCSDAFGDPYASLYALRDRVRAAPRTVVVRDPLSHRPREMRLDEGSVVLIARLFAYAPESAALLPLLLHEALEGRPEPLVAQASLVWDSLVGQINHGMQLSVTCAEDAPRLADRADDAGLLLGNSITGVTLAQCAVWPKGPVSAGFHEPLRGDIPVLLLSGEFDPVTPPRYADEVLATLGTARHLVAPGQGHFVLVRGCAPRLASTFVDTLDPAALDASCLDGLRPTPFFIDYNGAAP